MVFEAPPLPPAPALQTTQSGFTRSIICFASDSLLTSDTLLTSTSSLPGWFLPRASIVAFCSAVRMTDVTFQDFERRRGVRSWETLPRPPRRRLWCDMSLNERILLCNWYDAVEVECEYISIR